MAMAVQTKLPTLEEYQAADRVEIVDGEIIEMSPNTKPQPRVTARFFRYLDPFVQQNHLGEVLIEASFVLDGNRRSNWVKNARTPDISFISQSRIDSQAVEYPDDDPWWLAPDIAVEVISPTDQMPDVMDKLKAYLAYGVLLVILVFPKTKTVSVHTPDNPLGTTLSESDTLTAEPVISGWSMPVSALFPD
jgi:Uma2 family endonuclease